MQISSSKGQESCSDVEAKVAWNEEEVAVGFACSHGTILWVKMTPAEAYRLSKEMLAIAIEIKEIHEND